MAAFVACAFDIYMSDQSAMRWFEEGSRKRLPQRSMKFVLQGSSGSGKTSKLLQLALCSARQGCHVLIVGISSRLRSVPLQGVNSSDTDEILNRIQFR